MDVEQRARELLAVQYVNEGRMLSAKEAMDGHDLQAHAEYLVLRAIIAALTPPEGDMGNPMSVPEGYVLVPVEPTEEEVRATNEAQQEFFDDNVQSQFFSSGHYMEESIRHALRAVRSARPEVKP